MFFFVLISFSWRRKRRERKFSSLVVLRCDERFVCCLEPLFAAIKISISRMIAPFPNASLFTFSTQNLAIKTINLSFLNYIFISFFFTINFVSFLLFSQLNSRKARNRMKSIKVCDERKKKKTVRGWKKLFPSIDMRVSERVCLCTQRMINNEPVRRFFVYCSTRRVPMKGSELLNFIHEIVQQSFARFFLVFTKTF